MHAQVHFAEASSSDKLAQFVEGGASELVLRVLILLREDGVWRSTVHLELLLDVTLNGPDLNCSGRVLQDVLLVDIKHFELILHVSNLVDDFLIEPYESFDVLLVQVLLLLVLRNGEPKLLEYVSLDKTTLSS